MKGYVSVTFTDKQKQELFALYEKINEFNRKPKEEVFGYTTFTVDKRFLRWKWQSEIKFWEFKCPEELQPFFYEWSVDDEHYYFETNWFGDELCNIYHLVKQSNTVSLGEELARTLNLLQKYSYLSI